MDNNGLGLRNWGGYYDQQSQMKGGLSLQLMSAGERDPKPMMLPDPTAPMDYMRDNWLFHHHQQHQHHQHHQHQHQHHLQSRDSNKILQVPPINSNYDIHTLQILEQPDPSNPIKPPNPAKKSNPKKRALEKNAKPKKPRNSATQKGKNKEFPPKEPKNMAMVINGMDLDISQLPTPVCSCTGAPQQCYRWGIGGWQSACCTTNLSAYPLPMNSKRQGARIAGRKMSLGAFRKVLEKLVGEGFDLSNVIDLKTHWAKHGTNKFVTLR